MSRALLSNGSSNKRRFRLRAALVVPFIFQIVVTAGSIGYFSFKNSYQAVDHLSNQLQVQAQARIRQRLDSYFALPPEVNQLNKTAVELGQLDLTNYDRVRHYFWQLMKTFNELSYVFVATESGVFLGVGRQPTGELVLELMKPGDQDYYTRYRLDEKGNPGKVIKKNPYPLAEEPWFQKGKKATEPFWIVDQWSDEPQIYSASSLFRVEKDKKFLALLGADFTLPQISTFLQNLRISDRGRVFIVEPSGLMIASSSDEAPVRQDGGNYVRFNSLDSKDPLIQRASAELKSRFGNLEGIQKAQQFQMTDEKGDRVFVWVEPWTHELGLSWLVVTAVPEADFMGPIHENTRNTLILCLVALLLSLLVGVICSRWITEPVQKLDEAAKQIAGGNLDQAVEVTGPFQILEVSELAQSFNKMSDQLLASFATMESQRNSFARFFPSEYLKFLGKKEVTQVELGDHISKEMAVMFSDIRTFSSLSESMSPQENFSFVNAYLKRVSPEIRAHDGFVVKFLGDGMMAVFPNSVDDALAAGVAKIKKIQSYNIERQKKEFPPINLGVGIHVGHMMVGMVGEHNRIQGDAFSDNVNLTARIEGLTKYYGVSLLISGDVHRRLTNPKAYQVRFLDRAIVKGRTEPIAVFEVIDAEPEDVGKLKMKTLENFNKGITDYRAGRLTEAKVHFENVLEVHPTDKAAILYRERIEKLSVDGLPENWDGAWAFDEK